MEAWKRHSAIKKEEKDEEKYSERPLYSKKQKMKMLMGKAKTKGQHLKTKGQYLKYKGTKSVQSFRHKYQCPYDRCTYASDTKKDMEKHMKNKHNGLAPITKSKYYKFIR